MIQEPIIKAQEVTPKTRKSNLRLAIALGVMAVLATFMPFVMLADKF